MRILLVEDEYLIAITEIKSLQNYGYDVTLVISGEDAINILRTKEFDIILMDINLGSGINGTEAAEIILRKYNIPILFLSSHTEKEIVEMTEKITFYGYVVKSSSITVLDASIKMARKLFEEKKTSDKYQNELLGMKDELDVQLQLEKRARELVSKTLAEKELLLEEVHHRIKNNMFTIISLLSLQAHYTENNEIKVSLNDASSRISSMMVLYNKLYTSKSGEYNNVILDEYIESILAEFKKCYFTSNGIIINRDIDDIELDIKLTQSLGIVINELLTNIAKYAFPYQESKIINVSIKLDMDFLTLMISDNGVGFPKDFKFGETLGFGLQLIISLVESLKGTIRVDDEWKGTKIIIEFKYKSG